MRRLSLEVRRLSLEARRTMEKESDEENFSSDDEGEDKEEELFKTDIVKKKRDIGKTYSFHDEHHLDIWPCRTSGEDIWPDGELKKKFYTSGKRPRGTRMIKMLSETGTITEDTVMDLTGVDHREGGWTKDVKEGKLIILEIKNTNASHQQLSSQ